jgi:hypothetical protein
MPQQRLTFCVSYETANTVKKWGIAPKFYILGRSPKLGRKMISWNFSKIEFKFIFVKLITEKCL